MANVEPVLIDCEPISPEGLEFSSTLGGYAVNGELTRDEMKIGYTPSGLEQMEQSPMSNVKFIKNGQLFIQQGDKTYNAQGARVE